MNHEAKIRKLMRLATANPVTNEQKEAYKKAVELLGKVEKPLQLPGVVTKGRFSWPFSFNKVKTIPWAEFFKVEASEYVTMQIKPDSSIRNWRTEDITRAISDLFRLPIDRISKEGLRFRYRIQERAAFEVVFEKGEVAFYISIPGNIAPIISRRLQSVWPGATIEVAKEYNSDFDQDKTVMYELTNRQHDLFSLATDAKDNMPLNSLMEAGQVVGPGDKVRVFSYFDPINQTAWNHDLKAAWDRLRKGNRPMKMSMAPRQMFYMVALGLTEMLREVATGIGSIVSSNDEKGNVYKKNVSDPLATKQAIDNLSAETRQKQGKPGIKTSIWIAAQSDNTTKADVLAKTVAGSYGDLSKDNELIPRPLKGKKKTEALRVMKDKQAPKINIGYNVFSTAEAANFLKIPGRELQEKFPNIICINQKETNIDNILTKGGIYLGDITYRGETYKLYQPVKDKDQLCLPHIVIGGMGQGKTKGYGSNFVVEAVKNGMGALFIDPAKGEAGNEIEAVLSPEQVERYDLGKTVFALDFCEVLHSERARNRLANTIISFFNSATDEAGAQTARFIRAAVFAMKTGKLKEILLILENQKYRRSRIKEMPEGMNKTTLQQYDKESDAMQTRIKSPIYNRLDMILGDEFLSQCLESENSLDMVQIMSKKKAIIFDVRKDDLGIEGVDIVVNLISLKIDLAMALRPKYMKTDDPHAFFVVIDEPHQYLRSSGIWKSAAVESRKWRLGYVWMFHEWKQIPADLRDIIKAALPHYTLYPSSKNTFEGLKEEIYPFTVEDGLKLKRFHAINLIRAGENGLCPPVIAKMSCPPSERKL